VGDDHTELPHAELTVDGPVATLTLNRPDQMNLVTHQMIDEILAAFDATDADPEIRAVIVTGAGKAFCGGADVSALARAGDRGGDAAPLRPVEMTPDGVRRDLAGVITLRIFESLKPVIAAVNGVAAGFGATMILPMDIRLASTDARFGFVFTRRGIIPDGASTWFLPRLVGPARAVDWLMSGRVFPAAEAQTAGLVRDLHDPDDLLGVARAVAEEVAAAAAPVSVTLTRRLVWSQLGTAHPMDTHRLESRILNCQRTSPDLSEGVHAFLEKRSPAFPARVPADLPDLFPWEDPRS